MSRGFDADGTVAFGEIPTNAQEAGKLTTLYFSDFGFTSSENDSVDPDRHFESRILSTIDVEHSMFNGNAIGGKAFPNVGDITIANDSSLDATWASNSFDGRTITIYMGGMNFDFSEFSTVFNGTINRLNIDEDKVVISIEDNQSKMEVPLQLALYTGAGGAEGGDDIEGKPKPLAFGKLLNVTPILIDATNLVYQVHNGQILSIDAVYDRGASLTASSDYTSYASLIAVTVSTGKYGTSLADGMFRLGASPNGQITCDLQGSNLDGTYVSTTGGILNRLFITESAFSNSDINSASFTQLDSDQGATVGIYLPNETTMSEVFDEMMAGIGGFYGFNRAGLMTVGVFQAPSGNPTFILDSSNIINLSSIELPDNIDPPAYRSRVGYQKNWTVQNSDIAASVSDARRAFLTEEYRISTNIKSINRTVHLLSKELPFVEGLFANQSDADDEASRLMSLFGTERQMFRVVVKQLGYLLNINDVVEIQFARFGLDNGKLFRIISIREDGATGLTELVVFGSAAGVGTASTISSTTFSNFVLNTDTNRQFLITMKPRTIS